MVHQGVYVGAPRADGPGPRRRKDGGPHQTVRPPHDPWYTSRNKYINIDVLVVRMLLLVLSSEEDMLQGA